MALLEEEAAFCDVGDVGDVTFGCFSPTAAPPIFLVRVALNGIIG